MMKNETLKLYEELATVTGNLIIATEMNKIRCEDEGWDGDIRDWKSDTDNIIHKLIDQLEPEIDYKKVKEDMKDFFKHPFKGIKQVKEEALINGLEIEASVKAEFGD